MEFINSLSSMTKMYIIEAVVLVGTTVFLDFLVFFLTKKILKKRNIQDTYMPKKKNMKYLVIPVVIILIGVAVICIQYFLEKPQIDEEINISVYSKISKENFKIMYHNKNILESIEELKNVDTSKIGKYNISIQVPYLGKSYTKDIVLNIIDNKAPEITTKYENGSQVSYTVELKKDGYTAIDDYDKDITNKVEVEIQEQEDGNTKVIYKVSDSSNNTITKEILIKVIDDIAPEINLKGKSSVTVYIGENYEEPGATAQDAIDGDLTDKINISSDVNTSSIGKYSVKYSVSDKSGNSNEIIRVVNVVDPTNTNGVIYLTFDDGPSSSITPHILDILKEKGIKATFFIINYSDANANLVKREANEGHTIGIHGYSHSYSDIYSSVDSFMNNITTLRDKVKGLTGFDSTIIRFPGGSSNTVSKNYSPGIMTALTKKVVAEGYSYFDWNVDCNDAGGAKNSSEVYNNVIKSLSHKRQNVVLMHDFSGNKKTLNALADIIDYGLNNGFRFSNITKSTPMVTHSVNN